MNIIKILSPEVTLASATDVGGAKLVRVLNNKTSIQPITYTDSGGQVLGVVTLAAGEVAYIAKNPSDKLLGVATSLATEVAFKH